MLICVYGILFEYMSVCLVCLALVETRRVQQIIYPETIVTDFCETTCGSCEPTLDPLEDQPVL